MHPKTIDIHGANETVTAKRREASRGIVLRGTQILMVHERQDDLYLIPGGGLEGDETPEECCIREVREETGMIVRPVRHFLTINEYYEDFKYVSFYYLCEVTGRTERQLTESELTRGLDSRWEDFHKMLEIFSHHQDYAAQNEEKRGCYLREFTALGEYLSQTEKNKNPGGL